MTSDDHRPSPLSGPALISIKSHVFKLRLPGQKTIIVKQSLRDSPEYNILLEIRSLKDTKDATSPSQYIVSPLTKYLVLPQLHPLESILRSSDVPRDVSRLSFELADGVQFLHDHHIAHLDIKPDNLLLTQSRRLQIIDFDASVRFTHEDQTICGSTGTEGYMAPEVIGDNPIYSPVRADRFSCGVIFSLFYRWYNHPDILAFGNELQHFNPLQRPPLRVWVTLRSNRRKRKVVTDN
ncbi:kinase-like domain-containing protein [Lentinula edodes]|uniref:non-specific serine/threonine protein kinase n=1 Tax=Lentinula lateritia TaxID=40482 RepID=A0A9W9B002_9AGAR|nr:kinase-like domain-containing protein [Lentinula edodes]